LSPGCKKVEVSLGWQEELCQVVRDTPLVGLEGGKNIVGGGEIWDERVVGPDLLIVKSLGRRFLAIGL
jgi:hypothetical protein